MRILMLSQFYAPIIGGEERIIQDLCVELTRRGHDVAVATLWQPGSPEFEVRESIRIHRIRSTTQQIPVLYKESGRRHIPPFPDPHAIVGLRNVIRRERPQIVHAHNWLVHSYLPLKRWSHVPLVLSLHDYSLACAIKRLMYDGAPCSGPELKKCLSCAAAHYGALKGTGVVIGNRQMSNTLRREVDLFMPVSKAVSEGNGLPGLRVPLQIIPNFVRDDLSDTAVADDPILRRLPQNGYLLFVGDLQEDKGIRVLLEAYRGLKDAPPLILIGREFPELKIYLPRNVYALGMWNHDSVMAAWRRCLIALMPSVWPEPFGLVALEAMTAGRPVIASRIGGLCDFMEDGETGYLVRPGNPDDLCSAIERLLVDPVLRERMGQTAQKKAREFRASVVLPQIENAYRAALTNVSSMGKTLVERQETSR